MPNNYSRHFLQRKAVRIFNMFLHYELSLGIGRDDMYLNRPERLLSSIEPQSNALLSQSKNITPESKNALLQCPFCIVITK